MVRRSWLLLFALFLVAGCLQPAPTPTLAPAPTASPTPSPSPTASPAPTPSASPTPSPSPTASPSPTPFGQRLPVSAQLAASLQLALDQIQLANGVPGMSAAVIMRDGTAWAGVSGQSRINPPMAVTVDTPFVIGSATKTFVTATIMRLADQGVLSIDDPLSKWLPTFARAGQITLRMLLSHTSGVYNFFEAPSYSRLVFGNPTRFWTPQEILSQFVLAPYCAPGTCYHYSNTGFVLLGLVIEKQTGMSLGDVFRQRWFVPLNLTQTYWQYDTPLPADAAYGHDRRVSGVIELSDGSAYRPTQSAETVAWAAGAIAASATDLASWCDALYGGQLLSANALAQMTDFSANPLSGDSYGLGTRTRFFDGRRMVGHTGSLRGFYIAMWHFPVENLTVAIELNLGRIDPNPMADQLSAIALAAAGYSVSPSPSSSPTASPSPAPSPMPSLTLPPTASPSLLPTPSPTATP